MSLWPGFASNWLIMIRKMDVTASMYSKLYCLPPLNRHSPYALLIFYLFV